MEKDNINCEDCTFRFEKLVGEVFCINQYTEFISPLLVYIVCISMNSNIGVSYRTAEKVK